MAEAEALPLRSLPRSRPRSWARRLVAALLVFVALVAAGNVYVIATTRARIVDSVEAAPARPVGIVLGNSVLPNGQPSRSLAERLRVGLALYQQGRVRRLIVSGAAHGAVYDEPAAMAAWLARRGVPPEAITLDRTGHRTAASMAAVAAMGVREALICTQGYHLPRALYLAQRAGIDALGVPAGEGAGRHFRISLRETLARAETVIESALR